MFLMVSYAINLPQSRITQEDDINKELSRSLCTCGQVCEGLS